MSDSVVRSTRSLVVETCIAAAAYAVIVWLLLYPLFADPARQVLDPSSRADGWLTAPVASWAMWAMAWDWHALTTAPSRLFEANIFHPMPASLATAQPLLGQLPIFAPVYAATGNPVLAYQLNLFKVLALCGAAMFALLRHWGVGRPAAFFGGFVYLFCPVRMASLTHVQVVAAQYLPLVVLFLDETLTTARLRCAVALAMVWALQSLCSEELSYLTLMTVVGYGAGVLWHVRARVSPRGAGLVLAAAAMGVALAYAVRMPRLHLTELGLLGESDWLAWARLDSAGWLINYLVPPLVRQWLGSGGPALYIGFAPLACVLFALFGSRSETAEPERGRLRAGAVGIIAISYLMALGPEVSIAGLALPTVQAVAALLMPDLSTVATPARFGLTLMLGIAALAGLGLDGMVRRFTAVRGARSRLGWAAALLVAVVTAVEYGLPFEDRATRTVEAGDLARPVYRALAQLPPGAVLELPAATCDLFNGDLESFYTVSSTAHWQPLLNGYGSRSPSTRQTVVALAESLPDARATELLGRMTGLRYVVVHLAHLRHSDRGRWLSPPGLKLVGFFGSDLLFEVAEPREPDLQALITAQPGGDTTLLGEALGTLPANGKKARLASAGEFADPVSAGLDFKVAVLIANESERTWPALVWSGPANGRVSLAYRWEDESGKIIAGNSAASPLPYDLAPGQSMIASLCVAAPAEPGQARLVIGLAQDGEWFADTTAALPVNVATLGF